MSHVYLHLDPSLQEGESRNKKDGIDLCNEETFGSGAVEEDWECDHNQLVQLEFPKLKLDHNQGEQNAQHLYNNDDSKSSFPSGPLLSPSQLNDEELELSNRQLAAAVEELVINSDLDQDAIDPAIVSLRKQSVPSPGVIPGSPQLSGFPGFGGQGNPGYSSANVANFFTQPAPLFNSDKMHHIWNENLPPDSLQKMFPPGFEIPKTIQNQMPQIPLQDDAILNAIRESSPDLFADHPKKPLILKAEDLEREMQADAALAPRVPSPIYGVQIPKSNTGMVIEGNDRSLPARSISPVFGSPKPNYLPIGTPPKHLIMDMMHQLEQTSKESHSAPTGPSTHLQGGSGSVQHPPIPPGLPPPNIRFLMRGPPPHGVRMPMRMPLRMMPPGAGMPLLSPDIMHRLGMRPPMPMMNNSPIGSPQRFSAPPPHLMGNPPMGMRPNMPPHLVRPGMHRPMVGFNNNRPRMRRSEPVRMGPGHLHPEHSKYVLMREQRRGRTDRRNYNSNHQRNQYREGVIGIPGDPFANIMTQREKDWVIKIQMMALQSDRPEIDDYYYQNFIERRLQDGKLNLDASGKAKQRLITPTKPNLENRKYVPVQFTNSLGKLTASSVYNPRQIIDIAPAQDDENANQDSADSRQTLSKRLVVYKTIEKAYVLLITIEETGFQLATASPGNDTERDLAELEMRSKVSLLEQVLGFDDGARFNLHDDPVFQVMKVRKGKKLITRVIPFLDQDHAIAVVQSIFSHLAILIKRDARDGVLHEMYGPISRVLSSLDFDQLISVCALLTPFALSAAVRDQVGVSIICKLLYCGKEMLDSGSKLPDDHLASAWSKFIQDVTEAMLAVTNPKTSRQARHAVPSPLLEEFPIDVFEILAGEASAAASAEKLRTSFEQLVSTKDCDIMQGVSHLAV